MGDKIWQMDFRNQETMKPATPTPLKFIESQSEMNYWKVRYAALSSNGTPFTGEAFIIAHNSVKDWQIVELMKSEGRHTTTYDIEKVNGKYVSNWKIKNLQP